MQAPAGMRAMSEETSPLTPTLNKTNGESPVPEPFDLAVYLGEGIKRFPETEREWIEKACRLAMEAHAGQMRVSGDPYVTHSIAVARILIDMGLDWVTVSAALLHDTIEDTDITYQDLKESFPDPIPDLVSGVTKISSLNFRSTREEQAENLRKMILAMAKDIRVILIKLGRPHT